MGRRREEEEPEGSRLGRSLGHLVRLVENWQALGISLVSFRDGLDLSTPSGRLQMHVLGALATFERERLRERVVCGLARARAQGKRLGRPRNARPAIAGSWRLCARSGADLGRVEIDGGALDRRRHPLDHTFGGGVRSPLKYRQASWRLALKLVTAPFLSVITAAA